MHLIRVYFSLGTILHSPQCVVNIYVCVCTHEHYDLLVLFMSDISTYCKTEPIESEVSLGKMWCVCVCVCTYICLRILEERGTGGERDRLWV